VSSQAIQHRWLHPLEQSLSVCGGPRWCCDVRSCGVSASLWDALPTSFAVLAERIAAVEFKAQLLFVFGVPDAAHVAMLRLLRPARHPFSLIPHMAKDDLAVGITCAPRNRAFVEVGFLPLADRTQLDEPRIWGVTFRHRRLNSYSRQRRGRHGIDTSFPLPSLISFSRELEILNAVTIEREAGNLAVHTAFEPNRSSVADKQILGHGPKRFGLALDLV